MTTQCRGFKRDGSQCTQTVEPPEDYCWWHNPAYAEARTRAASRGGRSKASKLVKELHNLLEELTQRVIEDEFDTSRGAVANQLIQTRIKLLEFERKSRETDELAAELEQIKREFKLSS